MRLGSFLASEPQTETCMINKHDDIYEPITLLAASEAPLNQSVRFAWSRPESHGEHLFIFELDVFMKEIK